MDETFQLRARRLLDKGQPAGLDFSMLVVGLRSQQAASPAACAHARSEQCAVHAAQSDPLTEILLSGSGWRVAASAQSGCFNRAESKRRRNTP